MGALDCNVGDSNEEKHDFVSKMESTCPTCQGKGKLTQSQADNVVALIPAGDKRLKPRRTKLYLAITVVISIVCIFLIAFFLWPRPVSVSIIGTHTTKIYMPVFGTPWIDVQVIFQLKNENFFQAEVTDLKTRATWNKYNMFMETESKPILVKGLSVKKHSYIIRQKFIGKLVSDKIKFSCITGWKWALLEKFDCSATISLLLRSEGITDTYYGYIKCYNNTIYK